MYAQQVTVVGSSVSLVTSSAVAGHAPNDAEDTLSELAWSNITSVSKITVTTQAIGQRFSLTVEALSIQNGTGQGTISLVDGMFATDFVRDIKATPGNGSCTLRYRATATTAQGPGTDLHTVTFTLTSQ